MSLFRCRLSLFSQTGSLTVLKCQFGKAACQRTWGSSCCCLPGAGINSVWHYTLYPSFVCGRLGSNSAPPAESLHLTLSQDLWLQFCKGKNCSYCLSAQANPITPAFLSTSWFLPPDTSMAFGLIVGSVSKIRTLPSSEIHDGLGSWHGDERSRPQWLSPPCSSLCASCLEEGSVCQESVL